MKNKMLLYHVNAKRMTFLMLINQLINFRTKDLNDRLGEEPPIFFQASSIGNFSVAMGNY